MFFKKRKKERDLSFIFKKKNQAEIDLLKVMFSYAEGEIDYQKMVDVFKENLEYVDKIFLHKKVPVKVSEFYSGRVKYNVKKQTSTIIDRNQLYFVVSGFFKRIDIKGNYYNQEYEFTALVISAYPQWVYPDENYLLPIIEKELPKNLSNNEIIAWCNKKILELYQYEDYPPEWVQDENWPIYDGLPMIFTYQSEKNEKVYYHFIDRNGEKKKVITQYT